MILKRWRAERFLRQVRGLLPTAPDDRLERAIRDTAQSLVAADLGPGLKTSRAELVLIFARQLADANMRLSSSHWSSGGGRNVGMDVLAARERALGVVRTLGARRPPPRDPLQTLLRAIDDLMTEHRGSARDEDGYGIATLGEIRRDLERLIAAARRT